MVLVATQVKRRRGTTAENDAFTGAEGEITVDLTTKELRVHDGSTVGGHIIPTKDYSYSKTESDNLLSNEANVALDNITNSGKEVIAHQAMPSDKYVDLSLPAHGSTIRTPADGYFVMEITNGISGNTIGFRNITAGDIGMVAYIGGTGTYIVYVPVSKGDSVQVYHYNSTPNIFRLVYANGSK